MKLLHAGNVVLIGFGFMVVFMSYLVVRCTLNPSIMVSKNYYDEELKYQDNIDARNNTVAFSDSLTLTKSSNLLQISVPATINDQLSEISLKAYNQADDTKDKLVALNKNSEGVYQVNTSTWGKGNYKLKLSMVSNHKQYYKEFNY